MIESYTYSPFSVTICDASFMFARKVSIWDVPKPRDNEINSIL